MLGMYQLDYPYLILRSLNVQKSHVAPKLEKYFLTGLVKFLFIIRQKLVVRHSLPFGKRTVSLETCRLCYWRSSFVSRRSDCIKICEKITFLNFGSFCLKTRIICWALCYRSDGSSIFNIPPNRLHMIPIRTSFWSRFQLHFPRRYRILTHTFSVSM